MQNVLEKEAIYEIIEGIKKSDDLPACLPPRFNFRFELAFPSGIPIKLFAHSEEIGPEKEKHVVYCESGPYKSCQVQDESFDEAINKALLNLIAKKFFNIQEDASNEKR